MDKEIEISRIVIKIGKREEELTVEQARKLSAALKSLLGDEDKTVTIPYPYPVYPTYVYPDYPYWRGPWHVTYGTNTTITNGNTATYCIS